jgi:DNA-binding transcriptional LysR family regulator
MMESLADSRHLKVFLTVARTGNMGRAAKQLFLTPSAVSHALKSFEESLGCALFDRSTRCLILTREGERLLPHAQQTVELLESVAQVARRGGLRENRLHIGASPTACQYLIPAVIRELKESCPDLSIKVTQGSAVQLAHEVAEGRMDLGLGPRTAEHRSLDCTPIATDTLMFIVHPMHPWARNGKVERESLQQQHYVLAESRSFTKGLIDAYFGKKGISIQPFIEIGNEEVIKELVRLGIGVGVFPRWIARNEIERGLLVALPLGRLPPRREWVVCHRPGRRLNFVETLFRGISRVIASTLIGSPPSALVAQE